MRKLRLNIEQLQVESFSPQASKDRDAGTVRGHADATYGCTEGWDGCAHPSVGYTCDVQCSETHRIISCALVSCVGNYCPPETQWECN
jgi:hypothetical protein